MPLQDLRQAADTRLAHLRRRDTSCLSACLAFAGWADATPIPLRAVRPAANAPRRHHIALEVLHRSDRHVPLLPQDERPAAGAQRARLLAHEVAANQVLRASQVQRLRRSQRGGQSDSRRAGLRPAGDNFL